MRASIVATVLLASVTAHADPFVELGLGFVVPASDDRWTDYVDPSPKLAIRAGSHGSDLGGMASLDWTPISGEVDGVSLNRLRLMGHLRVARTRGKAILVGRFGAGIDYLRVHTDISLPLGFRIEGTDTDVGLALEAAGGLWFPVGASTHVGFELALPIGLHFSEGTPNDPNDANFDYTSIDIDILGGVRFLL